jgi:hypothetical protein
MKPALAAVLRLRIRVGSSETFAFQTTTCPKCDQKLCLHWPEYVLHIPLHRVVWLDCPLCAISFSVVAMDLIPFPDGEARFTHATINHLS